MWLLPLDAGRRGLAGSLLPTDRGKGGPLRSAGVPASQFHRDNTTHRSHRVPGTAWILPPTGPTKIQSILERIIPALMKTTCGWLCHSKLVKLGVLLENTEYLTLGLHRLLQRLRSWTVRTTRTRSPLTAPLQVLLNGRGRLELSGSLKSGPRNPWMGPRGPARSKIIRGLIIRGSSLSIGV